MKAFKEDLLEADVADTGRIHHPDRAPPASRIVYIDHRSLLRDSIGLWLRAGFPDFAVHTFESTLDIVNAGEREASDALYLYHMEDNPTTSSRALDEIKSLYSINNNVPLALLADEESPMAVAEALGLGVRGYIPTSLRASIAIEALRLVCAGGIYAPTTALHHSAQTTANTTTGSREANSIYRARDTDFQVPPQGNGKQADCPRAWDVRGDRESPHTQHHEKAARHQPHADCSSNLGLSGARASVWRRLGDV